MMLTEKTFNKDENVIIDDAEKNHEIEVDKESDLTEVKKTKFIDELKQIVGLVRIHSLIYIAKFLFLIFLTVVIVSTSNDEHSLIVSSVTFIGSLLFDQLSSRRLDDNYDFKHIRDVCDLTFFYVLIIFLVYLIFLVNENEWINYCGSWFKKNNNFEILTFFLLLATSLSALVEAVTNIPDAALPSNQKKKGEVDKD